MNHKLNQTDDGINITKPKRIHKESCGELLSPVFRKDIRERQYKNHYSYCEYNSRVKCEKLF